MPTRKSGRTVASLMEMVTHGELLIPEIKRGFKWSPNKAVDFFSKLYNGYPIEHLVFWETDEEINFRQFPISGESMEPTLRPLYVADGEQRLATLYRVLGNHPDAQVAFNCREQSFRIMSSSMSAVQWIKVFDIVQPSANHHAIVERLHQELRDLSENEISERIIRVSDITHRTLDISIISGIPYKQVADICRSSDSWTVDEIALSELEMTWPGFKNEVRRETSYWEASNYKNIDKIFLSRALVAVNNGDLSAWSKISAKVSDQNSLLTSWETVKGGLRHLVSLLKNNLKINHSNLLPSSSTSKLLLIPLVIALGERSDSPLDDETRDSLLYWFLVAITRRRYRNSSDPALAQDIAAARDKSPSLALHKNLGTIGKRTSVTEKQIAGPYQNNPYRLLSFLSAQAKGAHDWWYGIEVAPGGEAGQGLQDHHIHPKAVLEKKIEKYSDEEINDLANTTFISGRANRNITDNPPSIYFPKIPETELDAHIIPLDESLRHPGNYRQFLSTRRKMLAREMTLYLNQIRPPWLDAGSPSALPPGSRLKLISYRNSWDSGIFAIEASYADQTWTATVRASTLLHLSDLDPESIEFDDIDDDENEIIIEIGDVNIPVHFEDEMMHIQFGPFIVGGTFDEWHQTIHKHRKARPLEACPSNSSPPWKGIAIPFPVKKIP